MGLADRVNKTLKGHKMSLKSTESVWRGPEKDGISFSLLSRYLVCRERFRCLVIEGLKPKDRFNHLLEFGSMWHTCEEALASEVEHFGERVWTTIIEDELQAYCETLYIKYPRDRDEIAHWASLCLAEFPHYVSFWDNHPDMQERKPVFQEEVFNVGYYLPSRRTVRLRGKWDSVDLVDTAGEVGVWLQENKTKSRIDTEEISRQLSFDLQTMMYIIALQEEQRRLDDSTIKARLSYRVGKERHFYPIKGVRYNVVRRSAHKSSESMVKKIVEDVADQRGGEWFARWNVSISQQDIDVFKETCLTPLLEEVCDWWEYIVDNRSNPFKPSALRMVPVRHYRRPFGVYNVLDEGGASELDYYLATGSDAGLERTTNLFPELVQEKAA